MISCCYGCNKSNGKASKLIHIYLCRCESVMIQPENFILKGILCQNAGKSINLNLPPLVADGRNIYDIIKIRINSNVSCFCIFSFHLPFFPPTHKTGVCRIAIVMMTKYGQ